MICERHPRITCLPCSLITRALVIRMFNGAWLRCLNSYCRSVGLVRSLACSRAARPNRASRIANLAANCSTLAKAIAFAGFAQKVVFQPPREMEERNLQQLDDFLCKALA